MWSQAFWRGALERALKSALQVLLIVGGADGLDLLSLDWKATAAAVAAAAVLSLVTSVVSSPFGAEQGTASLVDEAPPRA